MGGSGAHGSAAPTLDELRRRLTAYTPEHHPVGPHRTASVLIPLVQRPEGMAALFTLRPTHMQAHGGQVSFPGGRVDPTDADRWYTALREANEELAIPPDAVEPLGRLDDLVTVTGYHVTPWVGLVAPGVRYRPSPAEVEAWFTVPLLTLADPAILRTMQSRRHDGKRRLTFYLTEPHTIWGATAHMVADLLEVSGMAPLSPG
ncbi:MAG: CoA pyrophosphatase [Deltaproteobacteria bacterium]|nr:CoA pyrophosphatase [Deltaproteobacteria bacterium]MCB9789125.1 CoA pyrophosphatase [Deltaproteobacteria bacterium]